MAVFSQVTKFATTYSVAMATNIDITRIPFCSLVHDVKPSIK